MKDGLVDDTQTAGRRQKHRKHRKEHKRFKGYGDSSNISNWKKREWRWK